MPLSELVVELAVKKINKVNPESSLYDAIVEMDGTTLRYLVNKVYRAEIIRKPYKKEALDMGRLAALLEKKLDTINICIIQ